MGSRRGVKVTYKVDPQTATRIEELAEATHRSKTGVIEAAVALLWAAEAQAAPPDRQLRRS